VSNRWWTVSAVHRDTDESYLTHVEAEDVKEARSRAYRDAPGVITIANVFAGRIDAAEEPPADVTPIRQEGLATRVSQVVITQRNIVVPNKCPSCRQDLRRTRSILQADLVCRAWEGHLSQEGDTVSAEKDHSHALRAKIEADAARLQCTMCGKDLWDGVNKKGQ
jgi:hypothetical protein